MVARAGPATYGPSAATPAGCRGWVCTHCWCEGWLSASSRVGSGCAYEKAPAGTGVCLRVPLCVKLLGRR